MAQAAQPQPEWWRARQGVGAPEMIMASQPRDQVRWGPIWAGAIAALATLIILSILGVAVGVTAFEAGDPALETGGMIWGGLAALIAFFVGGFTAGSTAAVGGSLAGAFNGAMVWALGLVVSLLLTTLGAGAAVGALGAFGMTGEEAAGIFGGLDETGLWWTFGAMVVGLVVAAIGGLVGAPRENVEANRGAEAPEDLRARDRQR
ncbi:MAG: hypothetical protein WD533_07845 [Dehalococcoidia bacterium]